MVIDMTVKDVLVEAKNRCKVIQYMKERNDRYARLAELYRERHDYEKQDKYNNKLNLCAANAAYEICEHNAALKSIEQYLLLLEPIEREIIIAAYFDNISPEKMPRLVHYSTRAIYYKKKRALNKIGDIEIKRS
jgi:hypothetical protein